MENKKKIDISQKVIERIEKEQVKMKSKSIFKLQKFGFKISFSVLMALAVIIFSLIVFFIQEQSSTQFLGLGAKSVSAFWSDLPFSWLAVVIIMIVLAVKIIRQNTLAYRQPLRTSLFNLVLIVVLAGSIFSVTGIHQGLAAKAAEFNIPFLKSIYQRALNCDFDQDYLLIGRIESIDKENKTIQVLTRGHLLMTIQLFSDTKIINAPREGDIFGAVGYKQDNIFYAEAIRKIELSALKNRCHSENKDLNLP